MNVTKTFLAQNMSSRPGIVGKIWILDFYPVPILPLSVKNYRLSWMHLFMSLACWRAGVLTCWRAGVLVCWHAGMVA